MPDEVRVAGWSTVKQGTDRESDAPGYQEAEADRSQCVPEGNEGENAQPAH